MKAWRVSLGNYQVAGKQEELFAIQAWNWKTKRVCSKDFNKLKKKMYLFTPVVSNSKPIEDHFSF